MSKPKYVARNINDLKDMLEQTTALHSDYEAFIKKSKDVYVGVTYKKYKEDVFALGTELLKRNIKGEKVILLSENRYEWCTSFMAATCAGGIIVPLSIELAENDLISKINHLKGKFIIFSEKCRDTIKNIRKKCPTLEYTIDMDTIIDDMENLSLLRLIDLGNKAISNGEKEFAKLEINRESIAGIFYGDTIVRDRGVMVTHKNLVSAVMGIVSYLPLSDQDKTTALLPFYNISQCVCNFLVMLNQGATVYFGDKSKLILDVLKETNPTIVFLSKDLLNNLNKELWNSLGNAPNVRKIRLLMFFSTILTKFNIDLREKIFKNILRNLGKNLRTIVAVGKGCKIKILKEFRTFGVNFVQCYDLPEASSIAMINDKTEFIKENTMGVPLPSIKAVVSTSNNKSVGEIVLGGDIIMSGYYDDRKATKKVLENDFLYTGEFGHRDKKGCFYYESAKSNN